MGRRSDHSREELFSMILDAARELVEKEGASGLKARNISEAIGYSPGTLYNLFQDLDEIVVHLNAATLDALYGELSNAGKGLDSKAKVAAMVLEHMVFVQSNSRLWSLLFQEPLSERPRPEWYYAKMTTLFDLLEEALDPLFFGAATTSDRDDAAKVIWSGVHGMCTLASEGVIIDWRDARRLAGNFVENYLGRLEE